MKKHYILKFGLLAIILFIISFFVILTSGKTIIYKTNINQNIKSINDIEIKIVQNKKIIKIVDKKMKDNNLLLKIKSVNKGKAYIDIGNDDSYMSEVFYVHNLGIITQNSYFGKSRGDSVIPLSVIIYISLLLIVLIRKYRHNVKTNLYQYKNVAYLGIIIFLSFTLVYQILQLSNNTGLINSINSIIASFNFFSIIIFPVATIVSILVILSNIKLLRKEGFTWRNMLGIILGILIILGTMFPDFAYNQLQNTAFIDIHNQKGLALYIYEFIETFIYIGIAYLECVLLATVILGIKSAKHKPLYNKDYIIILGCMIKKDGTLTPLLKGRVDKAIQFSMEQKEKTNKDIIFVPSGGQGNDEVISEAQAMKNYLIEQGISNDNIIIEDKSKNTYENIKFSYKLINKNSKIANIAYATTNYHVFRAGIIATNQNIKLEGIGSKTKSYFWVNAFIREFIATLSSEKKKHIVVVSVILLFSIAIILLKYVSNLL
ncbi:MAG: YdcF family protein [Bacilli bacterium]|nr:YdcF family protein [Bacilli bacterium]